MGCCGGGYTPKPTKVESGQSSSNKEEVVVKEENSGLIESALNARNRRQQNRPLV